MDPQELGAQSVVDIQTVEDVTIDAAAQGTSPNKAANTDGRAISDLTVIPDEEANPDKGTTPDEEPISDVVTIPGDASIDVEEATQEPFT